MDLKDFDVLHRLDKTQESVYTFTGQFDLLVGTLVEFSDANIFITKEAAHCWITKSPMGHDYPESGDYTITAWRTLPNSRIRCFQVLNGSGGFTVNQKTWDNAPKQSIFNIDSEPNIIRRCHIEPMGYGAKSKPTLWDSIKSLFGYKFVPKRGYRCSLHIDESLLTNVDMSAVYVGGIILDNNNVCWVVMDMQRQLPCTVIILLQSVDMLLEQPQPFHSFAILCNY